MNCSDFQRLLEDYHYGELRPATAARVRLHLQVCPACTSALELLDAEDKLYADFRRGLASDLEVTSESWSRVRRALVESAAARTSAHGVGDGLSAVRLWLSRVSEAYLVRQLVFAAFLICISVAGTLLVVRNQQPREASIAGDGLPVRSLSSPQNLETAMRAIQRAELDYMEAIQILSDIVDLRRPSMDAQLVRELEQDLRAIDETIAATRRAYYDQPTDSELAQHMFAAYSRKVELLQDLVS